ncbi:APC family permease [Roseiterribacter gracilis]|uniref:Amino acid transporter n=1 Tax=Roseiterribacter gracilis TaxID=2812848 RepID=A0A8S8X641_9PROT|nr:amino acid transporter [Rhodospirillales bacterium TMPK1]
MLKAKSLERIMAANEAGTHKLKRVLGPWNLIGLGVGAVIGAGLFSVTGIAAAENAGPAIVLSFLIAALGCAFAGMCYAEFASMLPVSGSAYTYAHATLGELVAWVIGWTLVLEYALGAASVAVSWSSYVTDLAKNFGLNMPLQIPLGMIGDTPLVIDLGAIFITCVLSLVLMRGISQSSKLNMVIVAVKVTIVLATICVGVFFIDPANYVPFIPENTGEFGHFGWSGILRAAGILFFAYVGFDAVSTASQEAKDPQRSMPIGILGTLVVCTILYVGFALVLTGMVNYKVMQGDAHPVATAINMTPFPILQILVKVGIIGGFSTVILVMLLGQSRVFRSMSVDGLLPRFFSDIHPEWRTPWRANMFVMVFVSIFAGFLPISTLGNMVSIGTLLAFVIVCVGVMVLRKTRPELPRPYRTPFVPLVPILGILVCGVMMLGLSGATWARLLIWLAIGMAVYFLYSRRNASARDSERITAALGEGAAE